MQEEGASLLLEVRLEPASSLRGRVLDAAGRPVEGARVFVLPRDSLRLDPGHPLRGLSLDSVETSEGIFEDSNDYASVLSARADAEGLYEVHGLRPGTAYHAYATAPGAATSPVATDIVGPEPPESIERDFRLRLPATLFLDLQAPAGVEAGSVKIEVTAGDRERCVRISAPGPVRVVGLDPGRTVVRLESDAFIDKELVAMLAEGECTERTVVLDPGCAVEGVVVDDRDEPMEGARVMVGGDPGEEGTHRSSMADADADGRFRIRGVPPGRAWLLAGRHGLGETDQIEIAVPSEPLRVVLLRCGGFRFRATRPGGGPRTARCSYEYSDENRGFSTSGEDEVAGDEAWSFETDGVPPGRVHGLFRVAGFVPVEREFEVKPGEVLDLGEIRLDRGRGVKGRVIDDLGRPAGRARVRCVLRPDAWRGNPETRADDGGEFLLEGIPPGPASLRADGYGWESDPVVVDAERDRDVVLLVDRQASLELQVVDLAGCPQANVTVKVAGTEGSAEERTGDDGCIRGRWSATEILLRAGTYEVTLERHGRRVAAGEVSLARGEEKCVRLVFP